MISGTFAATTFFAKFWPKANPEPGYWQYVLALSNVTAVSPVAVIVRWSVSLNARLELPPLLTNLKLSVIVWINGKTILPASEL